MNTHDRLHVEIFNDAMFQENGLLLWCAGEPDCWIVDPGFPPQADQMAAAIAQRQLALRAILVTHCHTDHIAGIGPLRERLPDVPIVASRAEKDMLGDAEANLSAQMGFPIVLPDADQLLEPGDALALGSLAWIVLDVAGHSPGGLAFYCPEVGVVITGDALFAGSIGRYDFPTSSRERLIANIRDNLLTLPPETVTYSGHGPTSTIGHERHHNMVLRMELGE
ncbi:MAG: MBL fold metallo-hydrolase [Planctomycetes bacterium]|nr:MBL fold metallo-hydrolase [Planctomycetota bacterium]